MADIKWSAFPNGGAMVTGDQLVGLRSGANTRLTPVIPAQVQQSAFNFAALGGSSNAFTVTLSPAVAALTDGMIVTFYSGAKFNTIAAPTLSVNGLTPVTIVCWSGGLAPNDITTATEYLCIYNLTDNVFQLINPSISSANTFEVQSNNYNYAPDTGVANAYIANILPAQISSINGGFFIVMQILHSNTTASTVTVNGTTKNIVNGSGSALTAGQMVANATAWLVFNFSYDAFVLINPSYSTASTANNIVQRDSNANTFANNNILGQTTTAAGGTITLTAASAKTQLITGSGATTVVLPAANTLALGWTYYINNNTASTVTVKYNDTTTTLTQVLAGMYVQIYCNGIGSANGTWDFHWLFPAVMADGQVVIGSTTSGPKAANLTAGAGVSITNAANSITIAASGAGFTVNSVAGTTQLAVAANAYILNNSGATTVTLPASPTIGDTIKIKGRSAAPWIIQANTSQIIKLGSVSSTSAGTATSAAGTDSMQLMYVAANEWSVDWSLSSVITLA